MAVGRLLRVQNPHHPTGDYLEGTVAVAVGKLLGEQNHHPPKESILRAMPMACGRLFRMQNHQPQLVEYFECSGSGSW